ncbi:hypothetical protein ISS05_00660 [Candidatus Woesearchaeota archaeon]|nr:hypothetical protein [Candidatus Woesearchaeota archaeon]
MIKKIKDLMKIKGLVDEINSSVCSNNEAVNNLKNETTVLNKELNEIKENQKEFLTNFKDNLEVINQLRKDFEEEIYGFKGLKDHAQKKILQKFEEELQRELSLQMENLKKDKGNYEELKKDMGGMAIKLSNLGQEIDKFMNISSKIREKDFEMEKFAKQLLEADGEKLSLMKKIDSLERLIARMRRGR